MTSHLGWVRKFGRSHLSRVVLPSLPSASSCEGIPKLLQSPSRSPHLPTPSHTFPHLPTPSHTFPHPPCLVSSTRLVAQKTFSCCRSSGAARSLVLWGSATSVPNGRHVNVVNVVGLSGCQAGCGPAGDVRETYHFLCLFHMTASPCPCCLRHRVFPEIARDFQPHARHDTHEATLQDEGIVSRESQHASPKCKITEFWVALDEMKDGTMKTGQKVSHETGRIFADTRQDTSD